jgi:citrate lyase beta subunit
MGSGEVPVRLWRSVLAVPGARPELFAKAAAGDADRVFLDLEDSVAPDDKESARRAVIRGLHDVDWPGDGAAVSVRINAIDTHWMYRDLIDVVEAAGDRLDSVVLPKAAVAADIHLVDALLGQIERATGIARRIGIEPIIETALGLSNVDSIAAAGPRLRALHFGPGDMAASLGMRTTAIGGLEPGYPGDQWHAVLSRIVTAARAHGLAPIAGPFGDLADAEGFAAAARRAAVLGCAGAMVVHPSQIGPANAAFTPAPAEVEHARRVLAALDEAAAAGRGAARLDGRLIDGVSARQAGNVVGMAEAIARR